MCVAEQTPPKPTLRMPFMDEHPRQFAYLSVEAFRKLTPKQKQEFVVALKEHLHVPLRAAPADQSHSAQH